MAKKPWRTRVKSYAINGTYGSKWSWCGVGSGLVISNYDNKTSPSWIYTIFLLPELFHQPSHVYSREYPGMREFQRQFTIWETTWHTFLWIIIYRFYGVFLKDLLSTLLCSLGEWNHFLWTSKQSRTENLITINMRQRYTGSPPIISSVTFSLELLYKTTKRRSDDVTKTKLVKLWDRLAYPERKRWNNIFFSHVMTLLLLKRGEIIIRTVMIWWLHTNPSNLK